VTISIKSDQQWASLANVMEKPEWVEGERYATALSRKENEAELDKAIADWTCTKDKHELMKQLQSAEIISGAVLKSTELLEDEQLEARQMHKDLTRDFVGDFRCPQFPIHFSDGICEQRTPAPTLGQHNEEVLAGLLGLTPEDIDKLREDKIIGNQILRG